MISSKNKIALILGFFLLIVLLLWAVDGISNGKKIEIFRSNNWHRKYQLKDKDPYDLMNQVNNAIREGWKVSGGLTMCDREYCQAMIKE